MGPDAAADTASRLFTHLSQAQKPKLLAMAGICAGHPTDTFFGDVIVADPLLPDLMRVCAKSVRSTSSGLREETFFHDIRTFNLDARLKQSIEDFAEDWECSTLPERPKSVKHQMNWLLWRLHECEKDGVSNSALIHECRTEGVDWEQVVVRAEAEKLVTITGDVLQLTLAGRDIAARLKVLGRWPRDPIAPKVQIGPIGTSALLQKDPELFNDLKPWLRKVLGVEMEAAAIGPRRARQQNRLPDRKVGPGPRGFRQERSFPYLRLPYVGGVSPFLSALARVGPRQSRNQIALESRPARVVEYLLRDA